MSGPRFSSLGSAYRPKFQIAMNDCAYVYVNMQLFKIVGGGSGLDYVISLSEGGLDYGGGKCRTIDIT